LAGVFLFAYTTEDDPNGIIGIIIVLAVALDYFRRKIPA